MQISPPSGAEVDVFRSVIKFSQLLVNWDNDKRSKLANLFTSSPHINTFVIQNFSMLPKCTDMFTNMASIVQFNRSVIYICLANKKFIYFMYLKYYYDPA